MPPKEESIRSFCWDKKTQKEEVVKGITHTRRSPNSAFKLSTADSTRSPVENLEIYIHMTCFKPSTNNLNKGLQAQLMIDQAYCLI